MALVLLGGGVTDIRGSIGGTTFSRNQGGNYARARTKPINQRSQRQVDQRTILSHIGRAWWDTLTIAERTAWNTYAEMTTWTNRLGQTISISGMAAFVRTNSYLLRDGVALRTAAPSIGGHAGAVNFTYTADVTAQEIKVATIAAPWDEDTDLDFGFFYMGLPSSPGREAVPKTFRFLDTIEGDSTLPPTFPVSLACPWTIANDQIISVGCVHVDPDGRASARQLVQMVAATP